MSLCISAGAAMLVLSMQVFTLAWTHSVEHTEWREVWRVSLSGLELTEARIKGSGAGMEPPANAVRRDGWFFWQPDLQPLAQLRLAVSGATGEGWRLCDGGDPASPKSTTTPCTDLETLVPEASEEIVLSACDRPANNRQADDTQADAPSQAAGSPLIKR